MKRRKKTRRSGGRLPAAAVGVLAAALATLAASGLLAAGVMAGLLPAEKLSLLAAFALASGTFAGCMVLRARAEKNGGCLYALAGGYLAVLLLLKAALIPGAMGRPLWCVLPVMLAATAAVFFPARKRRRRRG